MRCDGGVPQLGGGSYAASGGMRPLLVDCRAAADPKVVAAIEQAWNAAALDEQLES